MDIDKFNGQLLSVVKNLEKLGYVFSSPSEVLPGPVSSSKIKKLECLVGPLPKLLIDLYSKVGSVNLIGEHSDWDNDLYSDPFYLSSFDYLLERAEAYSTDKDERDWYRECYGGFALEISPDYYHKADVSGGEAYHIVLPAKEDPLVNGMEEEIELSNYLKKVIRYAGFPGLEHYDHNWPIEKIT